MTAAPSGPVRPDQLDPGSAPQLWYGAVDWAHEGEGWRPWRLDPDGARYAFAPELILRARMAAGVRLRFATDAAVLRLELDVDAEVDCPVDLVVDGELTDRRELDPGRVRLEWALPHGRHRVEVWLPQAGLVSVMSAGVDDAATVEPDPPTGVRWLCYGSSITQCRAAAGPAETWPALIARQRDWDLTCLGFGGQCHLDPVAVDTIAGRPADLISLCLGINVHGAGSLGERAWPGQVAGLIRRARESHPGAPILVQSPIVSPDREVTPSGAGITLGRLRELVHEVTATLAVDDPLLVGIDGLIVVGPDDAWRMPDGLHPDADGYRLMAGRIGPALDAALATSRAAGPGN